MKIRWWFQKFKRGNDLKVEKEARDKSKSILNEDKSADP